MAVELYQPQPAAVPVPAPAGSAPVPAVKPGTLPGRKKAAVLLVTLGPEKAAEVFKHLHFDEIEALSLEMAKLQQIDPNVTNRVIEELAATVAAYDALAA